MNLQENINDQHGQVQGNPESTEGKVSYGGTSEEQEQQSKEKEGFPAGSWGEGSEGGEQNILDEDLTNEDEPEE